MSFWGNICVLAFLLCAVHWFDVAVAQLQISYILQFNLSFQQQPLNFNVKATVGLFDAHAVSLKLIS